MDLEKIEKVIENSPRKIQDLLFSEEVGNNLWQIAENNQLSEELSLKMIDEVGYVILGLKDKQSFKDTLTKIGIPISSVMSILSEVDKKVFSKINRIDKEKEPVIITPETKDEVLKKLNQKEDVENLPMVEEGEAAHDAKPTTDDQQPTIEVNKLEEKPKLTQTPSYGYQKGNDPYREPV